MFQVSFSPESKLERSYFVIIFYVSKSAYQENLLTCKVRLYFRSNDY